MGYCVVKIFIKSLIASLILGILSISIVYYINNNFMENKSSLIIDNKLIASISGAVDIPGDYFFEKDQTIREIIFKANVKSSADIYLLGLDFKQNKSFEIVVPYRVGEIPKINYSEIKTINQLRSIGIKENICKTIIKYKNENKGVPTWSEIDDLSGIGEKTLVYLKERIDLS